MALRILIIAAVAAAFAALIVVSARLDTVPIKTQFAPADFLEGDEFTVDVCPDSEPCSRTRPMGRLQVNSNELTRDEIDQLLEDCRPDTSTARDGECVLSVICTRIGSVLNRQGTFVLNAEGLVSSGPDQTADETARSSFTTSWRMFPALDTRCQIRFGDHDSVQLHKLSA